MPAEPIFERAVLLAVLLYAIKIRPCFHYIVSVHRIEFLLASASSYIYVSFIFTVKVKRYGGYMHIYEQVTTELDS
jgi:hypothetical protein